MNEAAKTGIQIILAERIGSGVRVEEISSIGGGCINEAAKVKTNKGLFFAKWNDSKRFPKMLESEARGLELLRNANEVYVPEVIGQKTITPVQYLILEYIDSVAMKRGFWYEFGKSLASLHKHSAEQFGLDHANYIGSLPQSNCLHPVWSEFFILERLEPQIKLAIDSKQISQFAGSQFTKLFSKLEYIFPKEKPSLLHGDLWSGNYMVGNKGGPVIIDPAVYFGHREMDIAMSKLFGGFDVEFYRSYNEEFPFEKEWQERTDICNLYPLMVHVNLFGGSYARQVETILTRF